MGKIKKALEVLLVAGVVGGGVCGVGYGVTSLVNNVSCGDGQEEVEKEKKQVQNLESKVGFKFKINKKDLEALRETKPELAEKLLSFGNDYVFEIFAVPSIYDGRPTQRLIASKYSFDFFVDIHDNNNDGKPDYINMDVPERRVNLYKENGKIFINTGRSLNQEEAAAIFDSVNKNIYAVFWEAFDIAEKIKQYDPARKLLDNLNSEPAEQTGGN